MQRERERERERDRSKAKARIVYTRIVPVKVLLCTFNFRGTRSAAAYCRDNYLFYGLNKNSNEFRRNFATLLVASGQVEAVRGIESLRLKSERERQREREREREREKGVGRQRGRRKEREELQGTRTKTLMLRYYVPLVVEKLFRKLILHRRSATKPTRDSHRENNRCRSFSPILSLSVFRKETNRARDFVDMSENARFGRKF